LNVAGKPRTKSHKRSLDQGVIKFQLGISNNTLIQIMQY